jgi:FSR family fosmidomycin resistance protein-like MFS transporter
MSFFMTGGEFARTVGPLVAIGSVSLFGLEGSYPIMLVGVLASLWLYLRFREVPVGNRQKRRTPLGEAWRDIRHILIPLIAILVTRGFMHAAVATFLPTYIKAETGNLWLAGLSLTLFEASGVVGVMTTGSLSDFIGRRKMLVLSILGAPLGLLLFIELPGWYRFAALIFTGFTLLSTTPVMLALVQENAQKSPAAANGFFMMSSFLARSAIVVVVGFAGDMIGLKATYLISAALGLAGLPFIRMLPRR